MVAELLTTKVVDEMIPKRSGDYSEPPAARLGTIVPYPTPQNDVQIDRVHTGAVCKEMGERLSIALGPQSIELQPRLLSLMKQLAEQA